MRVDILYGGFLNMVYPLRCIFRKWNIVNRRTNFSTHLIFLLFAKKITPSLYPHMADNQNESGESEKRRLQVPRPNSAFADVAWRYSRIWLVLTAKSISESFGVTKIRGNLLSFALVCTSHGCEISWLTLSERKPSAGRARWNCIANQNLLKTVYSSWHSMW